MKTNKVLNTFFGVLDKKSGEKLEKAVMGIRRVRNEAHIKRMKQIIKALEDR